MRDTQRRTPLYFAALCNNYHDVVSLVEEGGANIFKRDENGKSPINVVKSNDILKYFFTKVTSKDLLKFDPNIDLFDEVVDNHPTMIEPFLNIFITSEMKDLDDPENKLKYDLALFTTGDKKERKQYNMMHRHLKLIDSKNTDMLLHPLMRAFTDLKWMQFLWLFVGVILAVFLFLLFLTLYGFTYVDFVQCEPIDLSKFEPFEKDKSLGESICGAGINGIIICRSRNVVKDILLKDYNCTLETDDTVSCQKELKLQENLQRVLKEKSILFCENMKQCRY